MSSVKNGTNPPNNRLIYNGRVGGKKEGGELTSCSPTLEPVTLHRQFNLWCQGEKEYTKVTLCQLVINFQ